MENNKKQTWSKARRSDEDVFVENSTFARHLIKARIIKENMIPHVCSQCGLGPEWQGKPMPLILDHINGINNDNRIKNLRFVCSNCDTQLETYKAKNKRTKRAKRDWIVNRSMETALT